MSATLEYRVTPLPDPWPGKATPSFQRTRAPFKANWTRTLKLLAREIGMLGGRKVEIAVDVTANHLRNDGQLRADARPRGAAVVVSFSVKADRLQFPADRFAFWQDNVDAVARALEALRLVDRYGVQQGRQYAGYRAIAATSSTTLTVTHAAQIIAEITGERLESIRADGITAAAAIRAAQRKAHPDAGGTNEAFHRVQVAKQVLEAHHNGAMR